MTFHLQRKSSGFTIVELLVAFGISALVLTFLTRLLWVSLSSSTQQDQIAEMNQNARYSIKMLGDLLMQAGADLQTTYLDTLDKDTIIIPDDGNAACAGFTIKLNPCGGIIQIPQTNHTAICSLDVDNALNFRHADKLQRVPGLKSGLPIKYYTLQSVNTTLNHIYFSPADSFLQGDAVCSFVKKRYFLNGTNLCIDNVSDVIAENIDSLSVVFLDINGSKTSQWRKMHSVEILVRARSAQPEKHYNVYADHFRRVTLTYKCRLRNKSAQ